MSNPLIPVLPRELTLTRDQLRFTLRRVRDDALSDVLDQLNLDPPTGEITLNDLAITADGQGCRVVGRLPSNDPTAPDNAIIHIVDETALGEVFERVHLVPVTSLQTEAGLSVAGWAAAPAA